METIFETQKTKAKYRNIRLYETEVEKLKLDNPVAGKIIRCPEDAVEVANALIGNKDREHFLVLALNTKNMVTGAYVAHIGGLNTSIIHPRDVFRTLILNNAASFVIAHNHPSGVTYPSKEDNEVTRRIFESGKLLGITLLDSLIIGDGTFYSTKMEEERGCSIFS